MTVLRDRIKSRRYSILVMISRISWVKGFRICTFTGLGAAMWSVIDVCFVPSECWDTSTVLSLSEINANSVLHVYQLLS